MPVSMLQNVAVAANGELPHEKTPRNAVQAAVYRHIVAWMPRTRVVDASGRRWLIRTAAEFKTVGKRLPWAVWTIQKALRELAADGWIEVRHGGHPFGDREYQQHCSWIALIDREQSKKPNVALHTRKLHLDADTATFGATFDPPVEQRSSITYKFSTRRQGEDASRFAAPRLEGPALREEAEAGSEVQNSKVLNFASALSATVREVPPLSTGTVVPLAAREEGSMPTAEEVIASLKAKKPPSADLQKPLKPQALQHEFAIAWIETFPGEAVAPANATRLGQLKNLIAYLRTQSATDREIIAMVHGAARRWPDFVAFVAKHGGPKLSEVRPSIPAMLTHRDKLVNFHRAPAAAQSATEFDNVPDKISKVKPHWKPKTNG